MTRHDDPGRRPVGELDRLLGEWLVDGPRRAPEAPITVAIDYARAHPRRPDPLRMFRADPMAGRGSWILGLQPAFALLAVGLLLTALIGVGLVGGLLRGTTVPLPAPTGPVVPAPSASSSPTATPSPSPTASPTPRLFEVTIQPPESAITNVATVEDRSLRVVAATDVTGTTDSPIQDAPVTVSQVDGTTIDVGWVDSACSDVRYRITLDATATALTLTRPVCNGDTVALERWVRLTFDGPVDAASMETTVDGPGASPPG